MTILDLPLSLILELALLGLCTGLLAGLLGLGGGMLMVPFLTFILGTRGVPEALTVKMAVATSSALGFPIALAGTIGYLVAGWNLPQMPAGTWGYLYWPALLVLSISSIVTAPLGARLAHSMDIAPLKRAFALVLYGLATYFVLR